MGTPDLGGEPTASCRLDWLSVSFFGSSIELQEQQLAYFLGVANACCPKSQWRDAAGRGFFANAIANEDAGIRLKWSEPGTGRVNAGYLSADMTGTFFKLFDAEERAAVYLDLADLEGFRQCTRLDSQRTVLEPLADAEEVHRQVRERMVWVAGYEGYSQLGPVDSKGDALKGASVVWGSPSSSVRAITYNKALEDRWEGIRAARHEVRRRKQPARDGFVQLLDLLRASENDGNQNTETLFAQSVLAKHMTYLDTSRLAKIRDKAEWPANWAADSEQVSWWREVVTGEPVELKTQWRITKRLEESMQAMCDQYGRKAALWCLLEAIQQDITPDEAASGLLDRWGSRLRDEDIETLVSMLPAEREDAVREFAALFRRDAAHNVEA